MLIYRIAAALVLFAWLWPPRVDYRGEPDGFGVIFSMEFHHINGSLLLAEIISIVVLAWLIERIAATAPATQSSGQSDCG